MNENYNVFNPDDGVFNPRDRICYAGIVYTCPLRLQPKSKIGEKLLKHLLLGFANI